jgi:hypothetical protein
MELRKKHPVFTYEKYEIVNCEDKLEISFFFRIGDFISFQPKWEFVKKHEDINYEREEIVNRLAFNLGMVELISYWKCVCPPLVKIKAGCLNKEQITWWKQQYFLGLGEFFYTNGIETSMEEFMQIKAEAAPEGKQETSAAPEGKSKSSASPDNTGYVSGILKTGSQTTYGKTGFQTAYEKTSFQTAYEKSGCLIPIGGGKDSNVTMELLRDRKSNNLCYMINKREVSLKCTELAGYKPEEVIVVRRSLDSGLLALNKEGYLNGHTPFSAIVAFSSVLTAYLFDKRYVVLSNEASANESTVEGTLVNHQYSKSFDFERDFVEYEEKYIGSKVFYFSLLRPFSELQIAKFFAEHEKYYDIFRSCNVGSKADAWCGHCPKCLFVGIILSPFIKPERLRTIFGNDMLDDESLKVTFEKLTGMLPEKPFECVGTVEEANAAVCMTIQKYEEEGLKLPILYQYYKEKGRYQAFYREEDNPFLHYYNEENHVPEEFVDRIKTLMLKK